MPVGYWFTLVALFSFGAMGIVHKIGDRRACNPMHIALSTMATAFVLSIAYAAVSQRASLHSLKTAVPLIALPFGASAAAALWIFQRGLRYGRIATSWLLINLSAAIPTVLSVVIYHEPMSARKASILLLIVISVLLLWWDRRQGRAKGEQPETAKSAHRPLQEVE
jgi:drug/metabolite transporter (DMT)-like permease